MRADFSNDAKKILRVLRERAMDGYSLESKTGLDSEALRGAIDELNDEGLLIVKGDISPSRIGEAYLSLSPTALGVADRALGRR